MMNTDIRRILVVGSINMDLVARCPHLPAPGETVLGSDFARHPGGKGANAAVAAARLRRDRVERLVAILGAVGRDGDGAALRESLERNGVDTAAILEVESAPTGVALISVAADGANSIVVAPGANSHVRPDAVTALWPALVPAVVLMQLEIPLQTAVQAAALGQSAGTRVLLDPAPAPMTLPAELLRAVDILIPNEGELARLAGMPARTEDEAIHAARAVRAQGVGTVVVKRGEHGALVVDERGSRLVPAPHVDVVDTTGAGDCFSGALAVAIAEGQPLDDGVRFATHAAALACTRLGAQQAMPTRAELAAGDPSFG